MKDNAKVAKNNAGSFSYYGLCLPNDIYLPPRAVKEVGTGIAFNIPEGYRIDVYLGRSIAIHTPISLATAVDRVDSGYTDEVRLLLANNSDRPVRLYAGDCIAQFEVNKVTPLILEELSEKE